MQLCSYARAHLAVHFEGAESAVLSRNEARYLREGGRVNRKGITRKDNDGHTGIHVVSGFL